MPDFPPPLPPPPSPVNLPPPGNYPGFPPPPRPLGDSAAMRMVLPVGRSGWAIAAGYLGLFAFIIVPAPLALIISLVAVWDLRKHREKRGWGRTTLGLVTGGLGTIVLVLILLSSWGVIK